MAPVYEHGGCLQWERTDIGAGRTQERVELVHVFVTVRVKANTLEVLPVELLDIQEEAVERMRPRYW